MESKITVSQVLEHFSYDESSGHFKHKKERRHRNGFNKIGGIAGNVCKNRKHRMISFNGYQFYAHRLVWFIKTGHFPKKPLEIDHINGKRDDNRFKNLRAVTRSQNQRNRFRLNKPKGVYLHKRNKIKSHDQWRCVIYCNGKRHDLGLFKSKEEALRARKKAEIDLGYHDF